MNFEHFCQVKGLRIVEKIEEPKGTIYIAETYHEPAKEGFPWGFYQTYWCLAGKASKGEPDFGQYLEFDALHDSDKNWSQDQKREARLNITRQIAKDFLKKNIETGRYAH